MKEEYRNIDIYPGYQVSNLGNIKSLNYKLTKKERVLKGGIDTNGYKSVSLRKDGKSKTRLVHQLVAVAFLNHIIDGHKLVVNHINFNKLDNRVDNLEIVTNRTNTNRKHLNSSSKYIGVSLHRIPNTWRARIRINGIAQHLGLFKCELAAAKAYQDKLKTL